MLVHEEQGRGFKWHKSIICQKILKDNNFAYGKTGIQKGKITIETYSSSLQEINNFL